MNSKIKLQGIIRNLTDMKVDDGAMQEVINLRPKDGAWRPVGSKQAAASAPTDVRFIHTVTETVKVFIGTSGGYIAYWVETSGVLGGMQSTSLASATGLVFAQIGRTLTVSNPDSKTTAVLIFDLVSGAYLVSSNNLPEIPAFLPRQETTTEAEAVSSVGLTLDDQLIQIAKWKDEVKHLIGWYYVVLAWELVDGSIVRHSFPLPAHAGDIEIGFYNGQENQFIYRKHRLVIGIGTATEAEITDIKTKYAGIISSLNVYITRSHDAVKVNAAYLDFAKPELNKVDVMYLYGRKPLEKLGDIYTAGFWWPWQQDNATAELTGFEDQLTTQPVLEYDNFSHHNLFGKSLYAYNQRCFYGGVSNKLFKGYSPAKYAILADESHVSGPEYWIATEIDLKTPGGVKTVFSGWMSMFYYSAANYQSIFTAFKIEKGFSYPDYRAYRMRILLKYGSAITLIGNNIPLVAHEFLNMAYMETDYVKDTYSSSGTYVPLAVADTYEDVDRVQACEVSNPFYFPAINSYRVQGSVIGFSTNAIALSQGQFGQYPLFCFTSEGIWALNIGSSEVLITSISPLSREVCNNAASIQGIDGGTVFSTDKGLYILSGNKAIEISKPVEGSHVSKLYNLPSFQQIINDPNLYQVEAYICDVSFLSYISGAHIAWDYKNKEILVSNPTYPYSWVYSVDFQMWYKISQVWNRFIIEYPVAYGYRTTGGTYYQDNLTEEDYTNLRPVHFETRPMKLAENIYKKIERMLLEGWINANGDFPFSISVFGSTDMVNWVMMNSSTTFNAQESLLVGRSSWSCKYFIVVAGGQVDEGSYFSSMEAIFEARYQNKLR